MLWDISCRLFVQFIPYPEYGFCALAFPLANISNINPAAPCSQFAIACCRRFNTGRLVCNVDGAADNVFINSSELGLCGRPLQYQEEIILPRSKDMLLPESFDEEADLKQSERQRPSVEATQAQKGTQRWIALLQSLLTMSGAVLKGKPCIVINLTGYIEDVGCAVSWLC